MPGLGHKSYIRWGLKEPSYGTFQVPYRNIEVISYNIAPEVGVIRDPSLYGKQSRRALYQGGLLYKGTFLLRLNYEGLEELYRGGFGTYTSAVVSGPVRDHTFKEGAALNTYSPELVMGDVPTGKVQRLLGCKLVNLAVRGTAGTGNDAMLQAELTVLAKDMVSDQDPSVTNTTTLGVSVTIGGTNNLTMTRASGTWAGDGITVGMEIVHANVTPGTIVQALTSTTVITMSAPGIPGAGLLAVTFLDITTPTVVPVLYHQAVTVDDGTADAGSSVRIRGFEVTMTSPHTEDRFYIGALNMDEALRQDFITVRWRLTQEFTTKMQLEAARAFTLGSPKLVFRHTLDLSGSSHFREFEMRSNQANLVEFSPPVEGYGPLISTATWEAFYDPTDASALVVRVRNAYPVLA